MKNREQLRTFWWPAFLIGTIWMTLGIVEVARCFLNVNVVVVDTTFGFPQQLGPMAQAALLTLGVVVASLPMALNSLTSRRVTAANS